MSRVSEWESESCESSKSSKSSESSESSESERVWVFQVFKNIPGSQLLSDIQTFFSWEPALWTLMSGCADGDIKNVWMSDESWEPGTFLIFFNVF